MDWHHMPPLAALRAFSAFAETGNVVQAGAALNVSHAAISQQLRALERHLDVALLDRKGRSLSLTTEGRHLARALQVGFGAIQGAIQEVSALGDSRPLYITCTPMFASRWLMPRLADFREMHPDIDLVLDPTGRLVEIKPGGVDVALRYGEGHWPGVQSEMLLRTPMIIVAATSLLGDRPVTTPADLLDFPWLEELGTNEATLWLRSRGVTEALRGSLTQMPGNLLAEAVERGEGVAAKAQVFAQADMASGRLRALFTEEDGKGYHIVTRPDILRPQARQFIAWLRRERDRSS